jgi:hypothetical protein
MKGRYLEGMVRIAENVAQVKRGFRAQQQTPKNNKK